jgi:hypothetical protein
MQPHICNKCGATWYFLRGKCAICLGNIVPPGAGSDVNDRVDCCSHCGREYNSDDEGHYDEASNLSFCCYESEGNYDGETGLPDEYQRAG